jgi:hypothetical protein
MIDFGSRCCGGTVGDANVVGTDRTWKFTIKNFAASTEMIPRKT